MAEDRSKIYYDGATKANLMAIQKSVDFDLNDGVAANVNFTTESSMPSTIYVLAGINCNTDNQPIYCHVKSAAGAGGTITVRVKNNSGSNIEDISVTIVYWGLES